MIVFPAIDLIAGNVVRLKRGKREDMNIYSNDPVSIAYGFKEQGAVWIHVVDLSATFEEDEAAQAANKAAIGALCQIEGIQIDVGGGVRSLSRIEELANLGASRIALGTVLVREPEFASEAAREFGDLLVADIAAQDGIVAINGWREDTRIKADDLIASLAEKGFKHLVFTDIARDGMQTGINTCAYSHIAQVAGFPVVASGGIANLDDLKALAALPATVIEGAITGRALYEGNFTLKEALDVVQATKEGSGPCSQNV
ncbi:MAG: 1-(5-phosphoribosyl)-5-((5-phosphoribosylamino)methylideneamino)imidazole-4-carboxamide isomerase [Coriobacteriales bacterium]|nr:1-(5-phosphoribosyl)-5-((5-phosphoribosylamino)methylideneamino)imidazole-4-carboxamide isomerase [Coriobacteriales bacterium]